MLQKLCQKEFSEILFKGKHAPLKAVRERILRKMSGKWWGCEKSGGSRERKSALGVRSRSALARVEALPA